MPLTEGVVTFTRFSPLAALIAGILILMMPRLLNYIVAIYLILVTGSHHTGGRRA